MLAASLAVAGCGENAGSSSRSGSGGHGAGGSGASGGGNSAGGKAGASGAAGSPPLASCLDDEIAFAPSVGLGVLDWSKFPNFELPSGFTAVWDGPHFDSLAREPLDHGFTHIQQGGAPTAALFDLPPQKRALLWTGVAMIDGQPWKDARSPWGNDSAVYQAKWSGYWKAYAKYYADSVDEIVPNAALVSADIESHLERTEDILALRTHPSTPPEVAALGDSDFVDRYQRDMAKLYDVPLAAFRAAGYQGLLTSYSDVPVRRTFWEIPKHTWQDWQTDRALTSYLVADPEISGAGWKDSFGAFYDRQEVLTPSAYFIYAYPDTPSVNQNAWTTAARWLAYLLFQVEANRAWSGKDQIVFSWMDYHTSANPAFSRIQPFMAHAAAIFPFVSGARGVWLWSAEPNGHAGSPDLSYSEYEWFVYGLYRLSRCRSFFEGEHTFWAPDDPVTLYTQQRPAVRGVIRGSRMLVAAQNPFAQQGEPSSVELVYQGSALATLELSGPELWLGVVELP